MTLPFPAEAQNIFRRHIRGAIKRSMDISISLVLLLAALPVLIITAIAIWLDSRGPILFRQKRAGKNGKPFVMYKLRTMYEGAEDDRDLIRDINEYKDGPCFKSRRDPRITKVGRWIRKASIDELPQLINVLRGDMSLVGPRPLPLDEIRTDSRAERMRISGKPGLTCLWQISGRTEIPYDEWVMLDLYYLQNQSLGLDVRILFHTIPAVLSGHGAY